MTEVDLLVNLPSDRVLDGVYQSATYGGSRRLFRQAAEVFGVELEEQEDSDWRALLGGGYLVDHLVDNERVDVVAAITDVINGKLLPGLHAETQLRFRNYMHRQTPERYKQVISGVQQAEELVDRQRQATTPREVIAIRIEEADLLASLLALNAANRPDALARQRLNDWMIGWSRSGYLIDSFKDIEIDYEKGESGLKPGLKSRSVIGAAALKETLTAANNTPLKLLGRCAIVGVRSMIIGKKADMTRQDS